MNSNYVVVFNGPPHSGKDTLANRLSSQINEWAIASKRPVISQRKALSLPMRYVVYELLGIRDQYTPDHYAINKDVVQWTGLTIRQMMIMLSEVWVKPTFGKHFWATRTLHDIPESLHVLVFSDGGFQEELEVLVGQYGEDNVLLVQLERAGCDWSKDSRGYLTAMNQIWIPNTGTVSAAVEQVKWRMAHLDWDLFKPSLVR